MASLVQAASDAAHAATNAVVALHDQQNNRGLTGGGFQEARKVVKQPEPFGSESHEAELSRRQDFNVSFKAWLFYGNEHFEVDFHRVEVTHVETPIVSVDGERKKSKINVTSFIAYSLAS